MRTENCLASKTTHKTSYETVRTSYNKAAVIMFNKLRRDPAIDVCAREGSIPSLVLA